MAGHSRWAQIKHKKEASDTKKGQLFSKLVREITIAARIDGHKTEANARLNAAVLRAKDAGLPKENIERAIARASGGGEEKLEEFLYEAIAPGGIMILIAAITDNKNRTLAQIKQILQGYEAKLVNPGSLLWNFEKTGGDYKPRNTLELVAEENKKIENFLNTLSEHDDIQKIYTNLRELP
jgi:YebC/PmpR family DNA-binding regulatory protein